MKNNSKYLKVMTIPVYIFMIYIALDVFLRDFEDIDVTGLGQKFLYILIGCFTILGVVCLKNAFSVPEEGVNFRFNKIMAVIFILFAIICFSMGIFLRTQEENMAEEYYEEFSFESADDLIAYLTKTPNGIEELTKTKTIKENRLEKIKSEINKEPNGFCRYFWVFTTGMSLGKSGFRYSFGESIYYMAYTIISALSIYMACFFLSNSKRTKIFDYENK